MIEEEVKEHEKDGEGGRDTKQQMERGKLAVERGKLGCLRLGPLRSGHDTLLFPSLRDLCALAPEG